VAAPHRRGGNPSTALQYELRHRATAHRTSSLADQHHLAIILIATSLVRVQMSLGAMEMKVGVCAGVLAACVESGKIRAKWG
jgi:hypothetical protein